MTDVILTAVVVGLPLLYFWWTAHLHADAYEKIADQRAETIAIKDRALTRKTALLQTATEDAAQYKRDVEWERTLRFLAEAELDLIRERYMLVPTLEGIRREAADGNTLQPASDKGVVIELPVGRAAR